MVFNVATPVEPLPIVKSRTNSSSFVYVLIKYSNRATGFWVGCKAPLPNILLNFKISFGKFV